MRTYYCSYCCLWSQRDFCNRLERSRTWEPFILLSFPAVRVHQFQNSNSRVYGYGKTHLREKQGLFFCIASRQSWKLQCSLNLSHHRCICASILVQITSVLLKQVCWSFPLTPVRCALQFALCSHLWVQELGFSHVKLVQSAHFKHSQFSGQSQEGETRNPWNACREVVSPCSPSPHRSCCTAMPTSCACAATAAWRGICAPPRVSQLPILVWMSGSILDQVCRVSSGEENPQEGH